MLIREIIVMPVHQEKIVGRFISLFIKLYIVSFSFGAFPVKTKIEILLLVYRYFVALFYVKIKKNGK